MIIKMLCSPAPDSTTVVIPLTRGKVAYVNQDRYTADLTCKYGTFRICDLKWRASFNHGNWYAVTSVSHPSGGTQYYLRNGKMCVRSRKTVLYMHTLMTGLDYVDHDNGDGLDNRESNIRPANASENMSNRRQHRNNTSGHVGVYWHKVAGKWQAQIGYQKTRINLGLHENKDDAIAAYHAAQIEYHGDFAAKCCNRKVKR